MPPRREPPDEPILRLEECTVRTFEDLLDPAAGTLRLTPYGVLAGALTIRATRTTSAAASARQVARFLTFFASRPRAAVLARSGRTPVTRDAVAGSSSV